MRFSFSSSTCCTAPTRIPTSAPHIYSTLSISMSVRSFTVFQDTPSDFLHHSHDDLDSSAITLSATDTAVTLLSTLAAIEKENLHPVTGQRPGPTVGSEAKKRKNSVLATKVLVVSSSKKHKESKGEPKRARKPLSSTGKSKSSDARKGSSRSSRSRKPSPLPPVVEEQESQRQPPRLSISQTAIDSRCYELTVSPLADVSEAYDATRTDSQDSDVHTDRSSVEPAVRDYFSPSMVDRPLPDAPSNTDGTSSTNDFTTPERKHIYSAFTFSSPSPSSECFRQAQLSPTRRDLPASNSE
ncbi:hypothetical protein JVU11DRAFT_5863 [Chiua virens]|nr:hypothetical protein JVU11DRAFT_5863 [Chiua virens]